MQILRTDWKGGGKFRKVAEALSLVGRVINDMVGENGIEVGYRGGRLVISGEIAPGGGGSVAITSTFDFALAYDAETDVSTCTISPGEVRMHGLRTYKLTEPAPVVLTGTIACVHLVIDRASPSAPLTVASDLIAETDGANMRLPLYTFEKKGASYALKASHHRGDFDFAAPIR